MPQSLLLAITWVSLLNAPFDVLRFPPISPLVCATASGEMTSASATEAANTHFWTGNFNEYVASQRQGWEGQGVSWTAVSLG